VSKLLKLTTVLLVTAILLLLGVRWAERDNRVNFTLARIDCSGLVDSTEIAEALRPYFGRSLFKLNTDSVMLAMQALGGVDSVSVEIQYPETVVISFATGKPSFVLDYGIERIPVTASGEYLPADWANDTLPVITVLEDPDSSVVASAVNLFSKHGFDSSDSIQVSSREIVVIENGTRVILDPESVLENWHSWQTVSTVVSDRIDEVDLRFMHQAVMRSAEET
jgi:cell division septal protein FtsQ